jgi:hypothetical protein
MSDSSQGKTALLLSLLINACEPVSLTLEMHLDLLVPAELDALCVQLAGNGRSLYSRHYPLTVEQVGRSQTLTVLPGNEVSHEFDLLLTGERLGQSVTSQRRTLGFPKRGGRTIDLYVNHCSAAGSASFSKSGNLTGDPSWAVQTLPSPYGPSLVLAARAGEVRRFRYDEADGQLEQHAEGVPLLAAAPVRRLLSAYLGSPRDCVSDAIILQEDGATIWNGRGDDTFSSASTGPSLTAEITDAVAADVNGDGQVDLVFVGPTLGLTVALAKADGSLQMTVVKLPSGESLSGARSVATIFAQPDDGALDLIVGLDLVAGVPDGLLLLRNAGDGSFAVETQVFVGLPKGIARLAVADFNGDRIDDIAAAAPDAVRLMLQSASGSFLAQPEGLGQAKSSGALDLWAGDLDGDCNPDLLVVSTDRVTLFRNEGAKGFSAWPFAADSQGATGIAVGDVDGDGVLDVVLGGQPGGATWWRQRAAGDP